MKRILTSIILVLIVVCSGSARKSPLMQLSNYCASTPGAERVVLRRGMLALLPGTGGVRHINTVDCQNLTDSQLQCVDDYCRQIEDSADMLCLYDSDNASNDAVYISREGGNVVIGVVERAKCGSVSVVVVKITEKLYNEMLADNGGQLSAKACKNIGNVNKVK